jgi:hypothetical protein
MSLNTIKTYYINFTAKYKVERDIGDLDAIITSADYTRFLGLTAEYSINWERHIDEVIKKLCTACYMITSCVQEYTAKHVSFIFPFCYDIWTDVLG